MNIDQRLEALTYAVEMLIQRQKGHVAQLDHLFEIQARKHPRLTKLSATKDIALADLAKTAKDLARLAHVSELRRK